MTISGSKSVKNSQKFLKKSHKLDLKLISPNFYSLANFKYINSYKMRKKSLVLLHKFWTYFFQIGKVEAPFTNLLSIAINNFIKPKVAFFSK